MPLLFSIETSNEILMTKNGVKKKKNEVRFNRHKNHSNVVGSSLSQSGLMIIKSIIFSVSTDLMRQLTTVILIIFDCNQPELQFTRTFPYFVYAYEFACAFCVCYRMIFDFQNVSSIDQPFRSLQLRCKSSPSYHSFDERAYLHFVNFNEKI